MRAFAICLGLVLLLSGCGPSDSDTDDLNAAAAANICGTYPNCEGSVCWNGQLCICKKDDEGQVCSPTSCIADLACY